MASESPRGRVDQFFASRKKRKALSPVSKSGRLEQIRNQIEGSPSSKGSLEPYLETSECNDPPAKIPKSDCEVKERRVPSKRNLTLEVSGLFCSDENRNTSLLNQEKLQVVETSCDTQRLDSGLLSDIGCCATKVNGKNPLESGNAAQNSELKEFATGFLSLYCSELQSSVSLPSEAKVIADKRHISSLSSVQEEKSAKRKHYEADEIQSDRCNDFTASPKPIHIAKDTVPKNPSTSQTSLRRCSHESIPDNPEQHGTPCSFTKPLVQETPHSSKRGSSLFSPGEAFWNEAIQVADGLVAPSNDLLSHATELCESSNFEKHNIDNVTDGESGVPFTKDLKQVLPSDCSIVGTLGKHWKNLKKEVSPLPVKHFDFFEGKDIGQEAQAIGDNNKARFIEFKEDMVAPTNDPTLHRNFIVPVWHKDKMNKDLHDADGSNTSMKEDLTNNPAMPSGTPCNKVAENNDSKANHTPASSSLLMNNLDLNYWLPPEICNIYVKKGISKLYPWQVECLHVEGVLHDRNLVYCASTSAGKSFVAEILMLRRVLGSGKIALLVLPYVSICTEKAEHLEVLLEPLNKHVRSYYGNQGGGTLPKDTSVAVCTIEKANSLINRLLEEGRLSELGTIVIDELHMVGDQSRGYLLELLLTKLRYAAGEGNVESSSGESSGSSSGKYDPARGLQIVGMSATLPNVTAVAEWLQAALYETNFRPVPLEEYIKVGSAIYNKEMEMIRSLPKSADIGGKDPDHIVELCNEVVQEGHSVLIFCSSRKGCESTARHIAKYLKKFSVSPRSEQNESFDVASAIDSLRRSPAGLDPILEETLPMGVAYHHAGLTVEERETVETCYRKGLVRVLTATSTLAAGVNLPARRVIFRQPRIGRDFIDGTRYRQMAGRAGRTGIDTKGESVLICKPGEAKRILALLNDSCPPLNSCLSEDKNGMTHAILEVVAGGIVQTASDINRYVRCTLLNSTKPFEDVVKSAQDSLRWLCHKRFLEWNEETKLYNSTPLGRASFGSSLCPEESLIVLDDLVRAREGFVLASDLHLVYLVTPINVDVEPDWELYYERFMQLSSLDQSVGNRVGVQEPFLMRMAHGAPLRASHKSRDKSKGFQGKPDNRLGTPNQSMMLSEEQMLRVCKRFYVALILSRLVQEVPVGEVCEGFKVARGMVQALQENAGRFASMVSVFCERLGWQDLESLVAKFQNRVSFGVRAEIVELTSIPYVKGSRARALYKAGLRTPQGIAEASVPEIAKALFDSTAWSAHSVAQRKLHLGVAKKIKNGARKIVLEKAEEARVAAFSAFKSLGLEIPQFSRPLLSVAAGNAPQKDLTSSGGESTSSHDLMLLPQDTEVPPNVHRGEIPEIIQETEGDKSVDASAVCFVPSAKEKSAADTPVTDIKNQSNELADRIDHYLPNGVSTFIVSNENTSEPRSIGSRKNTSEKGPIRVTSIPGGIDAFLDLWDKLEEFFFDIHFNKKSELSSIAPFELHGIAICWDNSPVYYFDVPRDLFRCSSQGVHATGSKEALKPELQVEMAKNRWSRIGIIMGRKNVKKFNWNLKVQLQVLKIPAVTVNRFSSLHGGIKSLGLDLIDNSYFMFCPVHVSDAIDMSVVAWILSPDEEKSSYPNLEKEVKKRLSSEAVGYANRSGRWKDQTRQAAHNGCCRRVAQTRALVSVLWKLLEAEELVTPLMGIELRLVNILADMEITGIGVDMEGCLRARHILGKRLNYLEKKAYELAGKTFSISMPADIANILYEHLKLPMPEGDKGKYHPSTDKHCLDMLRNEHPIIPVIKEHRTLAKLLNSTLGSICSLSRLSMKSQKYTLHGHWLQTSTATGRLAMEEPNLQCVEHMVEVETEEGDGESGDVLHKINARDIFTSTQDGWLMVTADYSQIELRLMAHFSSDSSLIELLSSPQGDVFTMIAAKWSGKDESNVSSADRDQTKRLVYGILYGMGPSTLAEQLECSAHEAEERIRNFKKSFPGVTQWLQEAVTSCEKKGYVETLKGRKRFLAKIKFGNNKEKSKAKRQAVNTICQGSAADIIKIAMICLHDVISEDVDAPHPSFIDAGRFQMLKGRCRILLQVHDELVIEADPQVVKDAGLLLKMCMEKAVSLLVPLHVKLKIGKTWGSLEPFDPNS